MHEPPLKRRKPIIRVVVAAGQEIGKAGMTRNAVGSDVPTFFN
ncbi:MAG: hypothetical protein RI894_52 [Bacteroidota bacterium]|jgi:hypothetical protein